MADELNSTFFPCSDLGEDVKNAVEQLLILGRIAASLPQTVKIKTELFSNALC